jgi:hypothetical protein
MFIKTLYFESIHAYLSMRFRNWTCTLSVKFWIHIGRRRIRYHKNSKFRSADFIRKIVNDIQPACLSVRFGIRVCMFISKIWNPSLHVYQSDSESESACLSVRYRIWTCVFISQIRNTGLHDHGNDSESEYTRLLVRF